MKDGRETPYHEHSIPMLVRHFLYWDGPQGIRGKSYYVGMNSLLSAPGLDKVTSTFVQWNVKCLHTESFEYCLRTGNVSKRQTKHMLLQRFLEESQNSNRSVRILLDVRFWPSGIVVACVCLCARVCPREILWPIQDTITIFWAEVQVV